MFMSNRQAVRNIAEDYMKNENRKNKVYLKFLLYTIALLMFGYYCFEGKLQTGLLGGFGISCLIAAFFGLPTSPMYKDQIRDEVVPDAIYVALKASQEIDPELLDLIRTGMTPQLTVGELLHCESEYHRARAVVTAPGYRAFLDEKIKIS
jgi:CRISPR/Cas system CMR-associated protein Cmr3 (group 5 of RAMP superfamily)